MATLNVLKILLLVLPMTWAKLSPDYYKNVCPQAIPAIREIVKKSVGEQPRMGASLLRLHFHDCFVNGCDGSVLLDDTAFFKGEKTALPNLNSLRGFDIVDEIKLTLNLICGGNVVSCADILAVAARDSVSILGGLWYDVPLGRRDSLTACFNDANLNLPSPDSNFSRLVSSFKNQGLDLKDLVALSGAHTIGHSRCAIFGTRIYNGTNTNTGFTSALRQICPVTGGDATLAPLDGTTTTFDNMYFQDLKQKKGLLHSDQELFSGGNSRSSKLVRKYSDSRESFLKDFGKSMIKMGNIKPPNGAQGQIRMNCRKANY